MGEAYYAYLLRCADNSLYAGYTTDIEARENAHNAGRGAKYTRTRRPVQMVYYEAFDNKSDALKREAAYKKLTRQEKIALVERRDPRMARDLRKRSPGGQAGSERRQEI